MIALIDADGFFAACELSRNPHLRGKPLMVLGSIGSFVLAKTQEAKEMGVKTVMPYWEAKKLCPNGIFLAGDFRFYTLVSRKLMSILKEWSPLVQVSSIDEAYMDLSGLAKMHGINHKEIGDAIRIDVEKKLGITVTVGISVNKVLAKMACENKKPNGTALISRDQIPKFLATKEIKKIPGIGYRKIKTLEKYGFKNALELSKLGISTVKNLFGRNGLMLWRELHGEYMFRVESERKPPKKIGRTSSFHKSTQDLKEVEGLAFYHMERAIEALHRNTLATGEFFLYLRDQEFKTMYLSHKTEKPTNDFFQLYQGLKKLISKIPPGKYWRSAGILLTDLRSSKIKQLSLFEDLGELKKEEDLNDAKDELNKRFGQFTVTTASSLFFERKRRGKEEKLGLI